MANEESQNDLDKIYQDDQNPATRYENNPKDDRKISEDFEELLNISQNQNSSNLNFDNVSQYLRPSALFFGKEDYQNPSGGIGISRSSIVNFNSSVDRQKLKDKQAVQISPFKTKNTDQNYKDNFDKKMREIDQKLEKECLNCKEGNKENHIIEINIEESEDEDENPQEPWIDITDNDVIEQVIFDPQLGMVKREIHFGIIDYCTTYSLMKKIEMKIKGVSQDNTSISKSPIYASRFIDCAKSVFE